MAQMLGVSEGYLDQLLQCCGTVDRVRPGEHIDANGLALVWRLRLGAEFS
jgi:hypothetical protein